MSRSERADRKRAIMAAAAERGVGKWPLEQIWPEETLGEKVAAFFRSLGALFVMLATWATFLAAWAYCTMTAGFLFGFGLGWIPALILSRIVLIVGAAMLGDE